MTPFEQIKREDGKIQEVRGIRQSTLHLQNRFKKIMPTECVVFTVVGHTYEYSDYMRKEVFDRLNPDYQF